MTANNISINQNWDSRQMLTIKRRIRCVQSVVIWSQHKFSLQLICRATIESLKQFQNFTHDFLYAFMLETKKKNSAFSIAFYTSKNSHISVKSSSNFTCKWEIHLNKHWQNDSGKLYQFSNLIYFSQTLEPHKKHYSSNLDKQFICNGTTQSD